MCCLTAVPVVDISEGLAAESADNAVTAENIVNLCVSVIEQSVNW